MAIEERKKRILVVDDDPVSVSLLENLLENSGEVWTASNGAEAVRMILDVGPHLVITDWRMPEMNGLELCEAIRSNEVCGFVYVMLTTAHSDENSITEAFAAGVDDYLTKPFNSKELLARIRAADRIIDLQRDLDKRAMEVHRVNAQMAVTADKLEVANEKLTLLATTDELTGLINRREALARLNEQWEATQRYGESFSCIMLDVDHFKRVNDTLGHDAGDVVLVEVARTMQRAARTGEVVCRLGGEEFLVICPKASEEQAAVAAERLRLAMGQKVIQLPDTTYQVTISLGVAQRTTEMTGPDGLLKAADEAMYIAKRTGRNRVWLASSMDDAALQPRAGETPEKANAKSHDPAGDELTPTSADEAPPAPLRVLLVDRNPAARALCKVGLTEDGYQVLEATPDHNAAEIISRTSPDLIVAREAWSAQEDTDETQPTGSVPLLSVGDATAVSPESFAHLVRSVLRVGTMRQEHSTNYDMRGEQARSMDLLLDFSRRLVTVYDMDSVLDLTISAVAELTCGLQIAILLPDEDGEHLTIAKSVGLNTGGEHPVQFPLHDGLTAHAFRELEVAAINTPEDLKNRCSSREAECFSSVPLVIAPLNSLDSAVGVLVVGTRHGQRPFNDLDLEYLDLLTNIAASAIQSSISGHDRDEARDTIVRALATLAEYRDDDTGKHLERVTQYCLMLAEDLRSHGLDDQIDNIFLYELQRAVPLHDIGKVAIPDSILLKPGRLTDEEMKVMKRHAPIGAATIQSVIEKYPNASFLRMAEQIARYHHERPDGSGYPEGLSGDAIPLSARIVAVADVYDALTTKRVYKDAMPHAQAIEIIVSGAGTQFDSAVVESFTKLEGEFARLAEELSDTLPFDDQTPTEHPCTVENGGPREQPFTPAAALP